MNLFRSPVAVLCGVQVVDVLGVTVVVSALPRMLADLGASPVLAGLLVPGYAVGFAGLLLVAARLGDRWGQRRLLIGGLLVFAAASVLAALAGTMDVLVAARVGQGVAAAISVPNALVLLTRAAPHEPARGRALGAWNACGGLAGAAGLLVGGLVTTVVGWRWIFWANLVVAAVLVLAVLRAVDAEEPRRDGGVRIDAGSAVLQVAAIALVVAAADAAQHSATALVVLGALAILAVGCLVVRERASATPLVPPGLWRPRVVGGLVGSFGVTATTSTFVIITTVHLQQDRGFDAAAAGLMILPFSVAVVVAAAVAGRVLAAVGATRTLVVGLALIGTGAVAYIAVAAPAVLVAALVLAGLGNGAGAVAAYAMGTDVPDDQVGSASGLLNTAAQIGTATVVAIGVAVAAAAGGGAVLDHRSGFAVVGATAVLVVAAVLACTAMARAARSGSAAGRR